MKSYPVFALAAVMVAGCIIQRTASAEPESALRRVESFNDGWRFTKGDPPDAADKLSYRNLKRYQLAASSGFAHKPPESAPGEAFSTDVAYAQPGFNDGDWRKLDLPHDWAIEGPFDQNEPGETGKLPYAGVGWYRKHFTLPAGGAERRFYLDFDGAMSYANVWLNGQYVGGWPNGYASWRVDLTPFIRTDRENVLAVRLDNPPKSSRWYPGGGIYRNVWLTTTGPVHIGQWGTHITTPNVGDDIADVSLAVNVDNTSKDKQSVDVAAELYALDATGKQSTEPAAKGEVIPLEVAANSTSTAKLMAHIRDPKLWSPEQPNRYVAVVTVHQNGKPIDSTETAFGIRDFKFTAADGFLLNGKKTEINGVCLHHDLGALGAAVNVRARERQLEKLKVMGCNAIRTSHNPPEPELLELCDRMGFLVMEEAFDAWRMTKRENDYHLLFDDWHERDLRAMIRRDRNHPSIVLWSLGNEVLEQKEGKNAPMAKELAAIAHEEDATRPVCMALHMVEASTNGFQNELDVFGYNYKPFGYGEFRENNPGIPLVGSETSSCTSSRGEYFFPVKSDDKRTGRVNFQVTSYDYSAPQWAMPPDEEFKGQDENPFVAGEFVWTGFDYLGEPTPYDNNSTKMLEFTDAALKDQAEKNMFSLGRIRVPARSSYFGIYDLAGFPKDRFFLYQARWRPDLPMAHILPHWNWPDRIGQVTPVHVYTSGDEAELFLNGKSLGRKKRGPNEYRLRWDDVVYEPGELKVVAYRNGKEWATDTVKTTGPAARIELNVDRSHIRGDCQDLAFVTARVVDAAGNIVPTSNNAIHFTVSGSGQLVATDNGDATSHVSFQSPDRDAYHGLCLAIVRATPAAAIGPIAVRAESSGLEPAQLEIATASK